MDLLDRYLQAVKKHLPWQRQDDIIAELRANLESQLEDQEAEIGRSLTPAEVEVWLKQMGAPMQVAARYQPLQYLIGPAIFPTYWFVLRTAFFWCLIIYAIVSAVQIATQVPSWTAVLEAALRVPFILMTTAAWVTLVFAAIEFAVAHYPTTWPATVSSSGDWSPSTLPPVEKEQTPGTKPRSYNHAVAEVIFGILFLVWLLLIPQHPYLLMGPGAVYLRALPYQLAPVWIQFYWWVVTLNIFQLGWRCVDLARGSWQQTRPAQQVAMKVLGLIPLVLLLAARDHASVTLKHPALDQVQYGASLDSLNRWIFQSLLFVCAIAVLQLVWEIGRIGLDIYRKRTSEIR
jgi:hypothetical protein